MAQEVPKRRVADPGPGNGKGLAQRCLEVELAFRRQRQGEGGHPRLGERGAVVAAADFERFAADAVAGGMSPADLLPVGDQHLDGAHRAAEASEAVQVGGEGGSLRLTVGHRNRILP